MASSGQSVNLEFRNRHGQFLSGRLDSPAGEPAATALFAHCFTCGKDIAAAGRIARALRDRGTAVLRFDFTGLGHSGGEFAATTFSSNVDDLLDAADFLRQEHAAPSLLIGHSLGGAAVLMAAHRIPEVKAVASIAAPSDPGHVKHLFGDSVHEILAAGEAEVQLAGRSFRVRKQFLDDLSEHNMAEALRAFRGAVAIFHSPVDELVDIEHAAAIYRFARHPKSFLSLDDADHLLSRKRDTEYVAALLTAWSSRWGTADLGGQPT